jgi:hypothetical protein
MNRRNQFGRANASVFIGVNQRQSFGIKLQAAGGTGQSYPELLIQLIQGHEIGAGVQSNLVESACSEEPPHVSACHTEEWVDGLLRQR